MTFEGYLDRNGRRLHREHRARQATSPQDVLNRNIVTDPDRIARNRQQQTNVRNWNSQFGDPSGFDRAPTGPGGSLGALPGAGVGPGASVADIEAYVRSNYGYMAGFLDIPEVRNVLFQAAREGWDEGRLYGGISATSWWRNTSSAARQWQQLISEDPAEANRRGQQVAAEINDRSRQLGLNLSPQQIGNLAVQVAQNGWTDTQMIDSLLRNVTWDELQGGEIWNTADRVKQVAGQFMVAVSDETAQQWAMQIARGEMTEDGVISILRNQARSRFGWMASQIDQGVTPSDYFAPVRDMIAATLETTPEAINMMDPKWISLMEVHDERSGEMRAATLHEAMMSARQRPEWMETKNAQELTSSMMMGLADAFGR